MEKNIDKDIKIRKLSGVPVLNDDPTLTGDEPKYKNTKNEYQCPNCGEYLDHAYVLKGGYSSKEIIKRFICPNCRNNVYPHFANIKKHQFAKNRHVVIISFIIGFVSFFCFGIGAASFFALLWLISTLVFSVFGIRQLMFSYIISNIKKWDEEYLKIDANNKNNAKISATNKILEDFLDTKKLWVNKSFEYPIKNIIADWKQKADTESLKIFDDIANPLETMVENCLNTKRLENQKSNKVELMDGFVSNLKLGFFESYNVDLSVFDK